ncbi:MAG: Holliday junction resolvase RuvX [Burkholderiaceae bacterium]|nr:Holliday junction resolvase RuvX [Burkholderiaceae bacterium]
MPETLLGFDFGIRRIGVAVGNTLTGATRPLRVVATEPVAARWAAIAALVAEWHPQRLVVGRPRHPDGAPLPVTPRCERFARQLEGRFGLPVELVDENFSSVEVRADRAMAADAGVAAIAGSGRRSRASEPIDDEAAAVILRQYLSSRPDPKLPNPG